MDNSLLWSSKRTLAKRMSITGCHDGLIWPPVPWHTAQSYAPSCYDNERLRIYVHRDSEAVERRLTRLVLQCNSLYLRAVAQYVSIISTFKSLHHVRFSTRGSLRTRSPYPSRRRAPFALNCLHPHVEASACK